MYLGTCTQGKDVLLGHWGLAWGNLLLLRQGFEQGHVISPTLFNLHMDCVIRDVTPTIENSNITFRYTINGALHKISHMVVIVYEITLKDVQGTGTYYGIH
jgi:hypothetical protein